MTAIIADDEAHLGAVPARQAGQAWPDLQIVAVVDSGPAAAAAIAAHAPDVAFLDIRMPGATGLRGGGEARRRSTTSSSSPPTTSTRSMPSSAARSTTCSSRSTTSGSARTVEKLRAGLPGAGSGAAAAAAAAASGRRRGDAAAPALDSRQQAFADGEITQQIPIADVQYFQADDKYTCVFTREGRAHRVADPRAAVGARRAARSR